jgi:hypothetical protein
MFMLSDILGGVDGRELASLDRNGRSFSALRRTAGADFHGGRFAMK